MNTAEYLIKQLEKLGISDVFGLPGDYNLNILYAIEDNNLNWVGCTNELNAGYSADGYARVKGYGAILTTYGAGELSAMNAIAGSFSENVPVVHIVGAPETKLLETGKIIHHGFQEPNPYGFSEAYKQITTYNTFLNKDNAKIEIDNALKTLVKERKPVYIAVPADVAVMEISDKDVDYDWYSNFDNLQAVTEKIVEKIKNSSNPVILGDILVKRFGAEKVFSDFVEESGIPATNFLMGTNLINPDSNNYLGTYFSSFGNHEAKRALDLTDCLISVGAIYGDINSYGEDLLYDLKSHIAIYGTYTYIEGVKYENVKMFDVLEKITRRLQKRDGEINSSNIGYKHAESSSEKLSSKYIYPRLQEFIKEGDIVVAETGIIPQGLLPIKFPKNVNVLSQMLWCSIGWSLPAAFGAGIAQPDKRVVLLIGDGSHQISAMEMGNILKYSQKPVIIVLNNNGYTIERKLSRDGNAKFNDIPFVDYTKFARSFKGDIWTAKAETEDDFDKALRVTQIMDKLCYIEAVTDKDDMPELAKQVFGLHKKEVNNKLLENHDLEYKTDSSQEKKSKYKTLTHTSLKEFEE